MLTSYFDMKRDLLTSFMLQIKHVGFLSFLFFLCFNVFGGDTYPFWGHWYPYFGFLVTSPMGFKARVGSALNFTLLDSKAPY